MGFVLVRGLRPLPHVPEGRAGQARRRHQRLPRRPFKSAVEIYTRTDMSPEDREESRAYLNALWTSYQAEVDQGAQTAPGCAGEVRRQLDADRAGGRGRRGKIASGGPRDGAEDAARGRAAPQSLWVRTTTATPSAVSSRTTCASCTRDKKLNVGKQGRRHRRRRARSSMATSRRARSAGTPPRAYPRSAPGQGREGGGAAGRQSRRQRARLRGDLSRAVALQRRGQAARGVHGRLRGLGRLLHLSPRDEIWANPATITGSIGIFASSPRSTRRSARSVSASMASAPPRSRGSCASTGR